MSRPLFSEAEGKRVRQVKDELDGNTRALLGAGEIDLATATMRERRTLALFALVCFMKEPRP